LIRVQLQASVKD